MILEKYSGSGNDFLITHLYNNCEHLDLLAKKICDRHQGIGADGFIILKPHKTHAYEWIFFNSDGSSAKMCGNASRCVGLYAFKHQLAPKRHSFWAGERTIEVEIKENNIVNTNLGIPSDIETFDFQTSYNTTLYQINTGVPHLVIFTDSKDMLPTKATEELQALRKKFNANVNVVYPKDETTLVVHTYERGVEDITQACGTGMAAASMVHHTINNSPKTLTCIPPSQEELFFSLQDNGIIFEGKVSYIATCIIES